MMHCVGVHLCTTVKSWATILTDSNHRHLHSLMIKVCLQVAKYKALHCFNALGSLPSMILFSKYLNPHETLSSPTHGNHQQPLSSVSHISSMEELCHVPGFCPFCYLSCLARLECQLAPCVQIAPCTPYWSVWYRLINIHRPQSVWIGQCTHPLWLTSRCPTVTYLVTMDGIKPWSLRLGA
eukprot:79194-Ditylum_brightwellii.AAC.1